MEWTISFQSEQQIVVFQTHGVADMKSSFAMAKSIAETMAQYNSLRCLIDHSGVQSVSGTPVDIYYRPQEVRKFGVPQQVKIAEVILPAHKKHFGFLETVFRNRNIQFSVFENKESAICWLMK
jgi:hypothetical protein